jgi:hypothetical protein
MVYEITDYTKKKAKKLGVVVRPSSNPKKKIDVYKENKKISSIGANGYKDYPTYLKTTTKEFADERRRMYKIRHKKDRNILGSNGYYADELLW